MSRLDSSALRLAACMLVLAAATTLTGCEGQRQALADVLAPPDAAVIAQRIELATEREQSAAAVEIGTGFLQKHADPEGLVHRALVGAYLASGNAMQAARHMELAVAAGATAAPKAAPEASATLPAAAAPLPPASIQQSSQGISVQAGDAAVTLGK